VANDQLVKTFDGREAPGADVADCFDPDCELGCDAGILTRGVARPGGTGRSTDVCPCAVRRWQKQNPIPNEAA